MITSQVAYHYHTSLLWGTALVCHGQSQEPLSMEQPQTNLSWEASYNVTDQHSSKVSRPAAMMKSAGANKGSHVANCELPTEYQARHQVNELDPSNAKPWGYS